MDDGSDENESDDNASPTKLNNAKDTVVERIKAKFIELAGMPFLSFGQAIE